MSLRTKVLLPLVCFSLVLAAYLTGYWMPRSLANIEAGHRQSIERHLDSVCEALVPLLLGHQLDAVYENLDTLMKNNQDWIELRLLDAQNRSLYPLELPPESPGIQRKDVYLVERPIRYLDKDLGRISLRVDFAPRLSVLRRRHWELMLILLGVIAAFLTATGIVLERLVVRPVSLLSHASRRLAENDFSAPLIKIGGDEVGVLVDDFNGMRTAIRDYRSHLQDSHEQLQAELAERVKAEQELEEAHERLRIVLNSLDAIVYVADMNTYEMLFINKYLEDIFGDITGKPCWQGVQAGQSGPCAFCTNKYLLTPTGEPAGVHQWEFRNTVNGHWYDVRDRAIRWVDGRIVRMEIATDITHRKQAEEALRSSELFIKNILETVDEGFIVVGRDYRIQSANRAYSRLAGVPEDVVPGSFCYTVSHHLDKPCFEAGEDCPVRLTFETGSPHTVIHTHASQNGEEHYVEIKSYPFADSSGQVVSVIETVNNITEKRKLEEQLRQSQKMEAIGTLAGGVAHDFNNILTAIIGYGNIVKMKMKPEDPLRPSIDQILAASDRAAQLTQSLLAFGRKQIINPRPVDLNDVVKRVQKLLLRLIGEDIELTTRLYEESLIVMADPGQIEQVLMNLATNARDAMPGGGELTISTRQVDLAEDFVSAHGYGKAGTYALIEVSDSGAGMDQETREKIFEPFFTTKEVGKGTGLGLAIVYGIIKQHNGNINVYSEPGKGTTFKIYLPMVASAEEQARFEAPVTVPAGGTETILLAEDDDAVRNLTSTILTDFGYRVIEAVDGEDAIEQFAKHADSVRLMILDVIMPKKTGKEACAAIQALKPGVHVLFISGYTSDVLNKRGLLESDTERAEFITKPVNPFELMRKIRELLDRK